MTETPEQPKARAPQPQAGTQLPDHLRDDAPYKVCNLCGESKMARELKPNLYEPGQAAVRLDEFLKAMRGVREVTANGSPSGVERESDVPASSRQLRQRMLKLEQSVTIAEENKSRWIHCDTCDIRALLEAWQASARDQRTFPDCSVGTAHECCVARMKRLEKEQYGVNWLGSAREIQPAPEDLLMALESMFTSTSSPAEYTRIRDAAWLVADKYREIEIKQRGCARETVNPPAKGIK